MKELNYPNAKSFLFLIGINYTFITFGPKTCLLKIFMISRTLDPISGNLLADCVGALPIAFNLLLYLFMN